MIVDSVFLLSVKDLKNFVYENQHVLGEKWWVGKLTNEAAKFSTCKEGGSYSERKIAGNVNWEYWLNTPTYGSSIVRFVTGEGKLDGPNVMYGGYKADCIGVRPGLKLDLPKAIFTNDGQGNYVNPYVIR